MDVIYWIGAILFIGFGIFRILHPEEFSDDDTYRRYLISFKPFKDNIQFERFCGISFIIIGIIIIFITFIN